MAKRLSHEDLAGAALPMFVFTTSDTYGNAGELVAAVVEKVQILEYAAHLPGIDEPMILVKDQFGCEDWYSVEMFFVAEVDALEYVAEELALVQSEKNKLAVSAEGLARTALLTLITQLEGIGFSMEMSHATAADCLTVVKENFAQLRHAVEA